MAIYERERARLGSHSAAAHRLGVHRTTLYDWLERARQNLTKLDFVHLRGVTDRIS
jgi:transposase-like protein